MADGNLLATLLAGQNPLAGQMVPGFQGAQLTTAALNPDFGHNEGIGGALAKALAGFTGPPLLQNAVQNTTQAHIAAQPNLARLLAQPDPYAAFAQSPEQYGPIAGGSILQGATPEEVAKARLLAAQGAFFGARANQANAAMAPPPPLFVPSGGAGGALGRPANQLVALPGTGRYQQATEAQTQTPETSPRAQVVQGLQNPQTRAAMLAQVRARAAAIVQARQAPRLAQGGAVAAGP